MEESGIHQTLALPVHQADVSLQVPIETPHQTFRILDLFARRFAPSSIELPT
jgi:hypothetical protein